MLRLVKKTPREEMDEMLAELAEMAVHLLAKNGEFYPIGVCLRSDGEIRHVAAYDGREEPPSADLIQLLVEGFRDDANRHEIRGAAIACDVTRTDVATGERGDAIWIAIEHSDAAAIDCYIPYEWSGSTLVTKDVESRWGAARIFPSAPRAPE